MITALLLSSLLVSSPLAPAPLAGEGGKNQSPFCSDSGTFIVPCDGPSTTIHLTTDAYDPDGDPLTYQWLSCPGSWLTDPTSHDTDLVIDTTGNCSKTCGVRLRIADPFGAYYVCRLYVGVFPGTEGCTPGYWKNHISAWDDTGFSPSDDFDTVFGVDVFDPDVTLLQALQLGGGGKAKLARHGVSALLNSVDGPSHGDVHFALSVDQVIDLIHTALTTGVYEPLATTLDGLNNGQGGCPQN